MKYLFEVIYQRGLYECSKTFMAHDFCEANEKIKSLGQITLISLENKHTKELIIY